MTAAALTASSVLFACGAGAQPATDPARARAFTEAALAAGSVESLPLGPLYINVIDIPQAPSGNITHRHIAGFVYAVSGLHRMAIEGGPTTDIGPGRAGFVGTNVMHSHVDPDSAPSDWWFLSLRPSSLRTSTLVPGQRVLYSTDDVPPSDVASAGAYAQALRGDSLGAGGRSAAHKHGGPTLYFTTAGTLSVKIAGQPEAAVPSGSGIYVPPGLVEQETNHGTAPVAYLAYTVTPAGVAPLEETDRLP